jgi:hypothetical protein
MKPGIYSTMRDLLGFKTERFDSHGVKVVFDYPDCTRTYDGREWTVVAKPAFVAMLDGELKEIGWQNFSHLGINERHHLRMGEVI